MEILGIIVVAILWFFIGRESGQKSGAHNANMRHQERAEAAAAEEEKHALISADYDRCWNLNNPKEFRREIRKHYRDFLDCSEEYLDEYADKETEVFTHRLAQGLTGTVHIDEKTCRELELEAIEKDHWEREADEWEESQRRW